jgi:hypothetical protein
MEVKYYNKLIIFGIKELPQEGKKSIIAPTCIMDNQAEFSVPHQEKINTIWHKHLIQQEDLLIYTRDLIQVGFI